MVKDVRRRYNDGFTEQKYEDFVKDMNDSLNLNIGFRVAETPLFLSSGFVSKLTAASEEIVSCVRAKEYLSRANAAIPAGLEVPNETEHTSLLAVDFAICKDADGNLIPQLIELQGFATLYGYQEYITDMFKKHFDIPEEFGNLFNGYTHESYIKFLRDVIVGDSDPENVILLEIEPVKQKTFVDFACTEKYLGIKSVCLTSIFKEGNRLFYENKGKRIPIDRIYNRVIFDELQRKPDLKFNFSFQDDLNVEWISHPNWFYKFSKYSLPFIKSKYSPEAHFLSDLKSYPIDLENYVLKPLYSFAGAGVKFDVTKSDLDSIMDAENYILQKKIQYEPIIETPDIPAKAEIRMLYLWKDEPVLVNNLVRLSKGKMMGVDFNKDKTWVGSSVALFNIQ